MFVNKFPIKNYGIIYVWMGLSASLFVQDDNIIHVGKLRMREHHSAEILSNHLNKQKKKKIKGSMSSGKGIKNKLESHRQTEKERVLSK